MVHTSIRTWLLVGLTAVAVIAGCGGKFDKPIELDRAITMGLYSYQVYSGFGGATSLSISEGTIYVAYGTPASIRAYYSKATPIGGNLVKPFNGLTNPTALGTSKYVIAVVDHTERDTVRVYDLGGGNPLVSFSDPSWAGVSALAVDDSGNIYVADSLRNFVRAYKLNGKPRFEVDLADSGFGIGHVMKPVALALDGNALLIAESHPEKIQVQRISIAEPQTGIVFTATLPFLSSYIDAEGNETPFLNPVGVAAGVDGSIFVMDKGNNMIFRYDATGTSICVVNSAQSGGPANLTGMGSIDTYNPPQLAASVYVLDVGKGIIHRWDPK
jgi:hypothetical protein